MFFVIGTSKLYLLFVYMCTSSLSQPASLINNDLGGFWNK